MLAPLARRLRDPITWTNLAQLLKTAFAVVLAWLLAVRVFVIAQPFLAPWAALLTFHATVAGTARRGAQQAAAAVLGVLFAFGAGQLFGVGELALGAAVLLGLAAGATPALRTETTTAAATAIVVLTTGSSQNGTMLWARLADTAIGIAVGLLVNLLVWPPLRDRSVARQINLVCTRLGALLCDVAGDLCRGDETAGPQQWVTRSDGLEDDLDAAWRYLAEARESGRLNPRRAAPRRMRAAEDDFRPALDALAQAVAETRSMARTIALAHTPPAAWDETFRDPWRALVARAGAAVRDGDGDGLRTARLDLQRFAGELPVPALAAGFWPVAGALLVGLRNILEALEGVTDARPDDPPAWRPQFSGRPGSSTTADSANTAWISSRPPSART
ncbi:MAG TPA: aromatic acid exporter family protein [Solirubrobacteraceae bacterium]|nr:aromatic acid exporter family protein [Solirubrobacteraceae bacterium]